MAKSEKNIKTENTSLSFTAQEVTKILLKEAGIKEGYYFTHVAPDVRGGFVNLKDDDDEDSEHLAQGIIIGLTSFELREVPKEMPLAVDASQLDN